MNTKKSPRPPEKGGGRAPRHADDSFSDLERLDRDELDDLGEPRDANEAHHSHDAHDEWSDDTAIRRLKKTQPAPPSKKTLGAAS